MFYYKIIAKVEFKGISILHADKEKRELRKQNFFVSFSVFIGTLGGMTFLNGENVLERKPIHYSKEISESIYNALKI